MNTRTSRERLTQYAFGPTDNSDSATPPAASSAPRGTCSPAAAAASREILMSSLRIVRRRKLSKKKKPLKFFFAHIFLQLVGVTVRRCVCFCCLRDCRRRSSLSAHESTTHSLLLQFGSAQIVSANYQRLLPFTGFTRHRYGLPRKGRTKSFDNLWGRNGIATQGNTPQRIRGGTARLIESPCQGVLCRQGSCSDIQQRSPTLAGQGKQTDVSWNDDAPLP